MEIASVIDHTLLKPDCNLEEIKKLCTEAIDFSFPAVCISPYYINAAFRLLEDQPVKIASVIGFPFGYSATVAKVEEIKRAINDGVDELDVVVNIQAIKEANWSFVKNDIESMTRAVHLKGKVIKIILETGLLAQEEVLRLCEICTGSEVDYVKTSTGYSGGGATTEVVSFLKNQLPNTIKIKASGGIRTPEQAIDLINAGAARLGTSSGIAIIDSVSKGA